MTFFSLIKTVLIEVGIISIFVIAGFSSFLSASVWTGGSGNWSSNANPGWNGTGVPNGVGAVASFSDGTAGTTTQDTVGLTLGTIDFSLGNVQRTITMSNAITLNQDGAGAGFATISNTNPNAGSTNRFSMGGGTLTLADDLLISNTGGSTNATGSIVITTTIGGAGNMTISNVSNSLSSGLIVLGGANTFSGNVIVQKGALSFGTMGNAANAVTLGSAGNGSATMVTTGSATAIANNITVASGTGGTLLLGSTNAGATTSTYSGTILLSGDLSITSAKTGAGTVSFSNVISGVGGLTKVGTGMATLSHANTYTGATIVNTGTLQAGVATSAFGNNSSVTTADIASAILDLNNLNETIGSVSGGGTTGGNVTLGSGTLTTGGDNTSTNYAGVISGTGGLTKNGSGTQTLSGTSNSYSGVTTLNTGALSFSTIADGGSNSGIGAATAANTNLILNGGTLQYTGAAANSDHLFSVGTSGGTLDASGSGALNLTGAGAMGFNGQAGTRTLTLTGTNAGNNTLTSVIGDNGGATSLTKNGAGLWILSGSNTYTGATTVSAGTLQAGVATSAFGSNSSVTTANTAGAILDLNNLSEIIGSLSGGGTTGGNVMLGSGTLTTGGDNTSTSFSGSITGTGGLTKTGSGTQTLTGTSNTYSGTTTLNTGILRAGAANALSSSSAFSLANTAGVSLDLNNFSNSIGSLAGGGTTGGNVTLGSGSLTTGSDNTSTSFAGAITGTGGLTKTGTGTQTLTGTSNTYSGTTTVSGGTLRAGTANALSSSSAFTLTNTAGVSLDLNNFSNAIASLAGGGTTGGNVTLGSGTLTTGSDNTSTSFSGSITGTGGLTKTGTGTLTLTGTSNTYSGTTTVSTGKIKAGAVNALSSSSAVSLANTAGVALDLNNFDNAIGSLSGGGATGGNVILGSGTLTEGGDNSSTSYDGVISGTGGLTKVGSGTFILTGTNLFTGATTVNAGTLQLSGAGATLGTTASVVVNSGTLKWGAANQVKDTATVTLNGGTLNFNGFSETMGTLSLSSSSTLNLGGTSSIVFADSSTQNWNSSILSVSNFSQLNNSLRFGTTSGGLTATQLGLLQFSDFGGAAGQIDINGSVTPMTNVINSGSANVTNASSITGVQTATQSGSGSLILTGSNTSTGLASATQGTLTIGTAAGGNWNGDASVSGSGTLNGQGPIAGNVTINTSGTYSPGVSVGSQSVGSLTVNSGGTVNIQIDGQTTGNGAGFYDQIQSSGAVTLHGGTLTGSTIFSGSSGFQPTLGSKFTLATGSTVTGKFTSYDFSSNPAGITFMPEYTSTQVRLFAVPVNYGTDLTFLTPSQKRLGFALQSFRPTEIDNRSSLTDSGKIFNGLMRLDESGIEAAFNQLSPEKLAAMPSMTLQTSNTMNMALSQRSTELRYGEPGTTFNGMTLTDRKGDYINEPVADMGSGFYIVKVKPKTSFRYFANATGLFSEIDSSSNRVGSSSQAEAGTMGIDYAINSHHSIGFFVGQFYSTSDFASGGGSLVNNTGRTGLFYDYHNGGFYGNGSVSAGLSSYESKRNIGFLNETAQGNTTGMGLGMQVATGYDFQTNKLIWGPTASLAYDRTWINSFDEKGSAARLQMDQQINDSVLSNVGFHLSRPIQTGKTTWIPEVHAGFQRQWIDPSALGARFAAGGNSFQIKPASAGQESATTGAGVTALLSETLSLRLSYDAILNLASSSHLVNVGVSVGF